MVDCQALSLVRYPSEDLNLWLHSFYNNGLGYLDISGVLHSVPVE